MPTTPTITRTVFFLGLVSLFTDMASEMIYPVLPLFLDHIGITVIGIGLLEGIAQATAGLSKSYFGRWSDLSLRRLPFVQIGYGLSAMSKPLLAFATSGWSVLAARFGDRLGKGVRTGARDALLSQEASQDKQGRVFGFHRSMDSLGAALGPLMALAYLWLYPEDYKNLFLIAFIPGLLAIVSTFLIRENAQELQISKTRPRLRDLLDYLKNSSKDYRRLIIGLLLFSLINSTDLFLLLFLKTIGFSDVHIIGIYVFYNLVFALSAYPAGILGDRFSMRTIFVIGMALFSVVYISLGLIGGTFLLYVILIFALYGLYAGWTDGISKAWISRVVNGKEMGSAIGNYEALNSIATMLASAVGGLIWYSLGATAFFVLTGVLAIVVIGYMLVFTQTSSALTTD